MNSPESPRSEFHPSPRIGAAVAWLLGLNIALYFLQVTVVSPSDMYATLGFHTHDLGNLSRAW